ncbi:IS6 family transposase [Vibrio mediterranei]|nr:IS6 family transposase [Vibrio mediterranei]MCG9629102.1 IS6 family transposase [Vibrio mediterranei]
MQYAPLIQEKLKWYLRPRSGGSWKVDEFYIKEKGKWLCLYRAVDKPRETIDFFLFATRNAKVAQRFLAKALRGLENWEYPHTINTDNAPAYDQAILVLKAQGKYPNEVVHRQIKHLNNAVEASPGKLKRLILKSMKTANTTQKGFEVMFMFKI